MPGIYVGTSEVKNIYVGTTPVKEVYVGTTKVRPKSIEIETLLVAGGGGGGLGMNATGGGGGGGGVYYTSKQVFEKGATYNITIGCGGIGGSGAGGKGGNTTICGCKDGTPILSKSVYGGGGGGGGTGCGCSGGSGGGGACYCCGGGCVAGQGNKGGNGCGYGGGGGGGAGGAGGNATGTSSSQGRGGTSGVGHLYSISGASVWYSPGGGGAGWCFPGGGSGGGVRGRAWGCSGDSSCCGFDATNYGGGGGGTITYCGGNGCQGVAIFRYPTACNYNITGGTKYTCGDYTIHCFTSNGTLTVN